ncbi:16S rRNA (guanine(527)-N(7))-methyltransferase RsmG [Mesomycoplasma ovipneumoniae]|uniref:16S rRNA (guanine(527)-N(7))-methyltransferase RsmG n=1 Tax=Mesomycoplasma ovipneumoniae TaxID=29562 RepID=UPI00083E7BA3|nr:16S rRNA (guanine(527)-N(7))-methyltransferase RsmG [Mesomycoplasma ovipneumoniae]
MYKEKVKLLVDLDVFEKLEQYVKLIEFYNQKFNLTGFSGDVLWKEGILESIVTMNFIRNFLKKENISEKVRILDIGAGVGFPSIPYLIFDPKIDLTICESMQKRCQFLKKVSETLGIKFNLVCKSVQEIENDNFDLVTARAVANLEKLDKIVNKIKAKNTIFAFIKGPKIFEELKNCKNCDYQVVEFANNLDKKIFIAFKKI